MQNQDYIISIDANAGFCWGVVRTLEKVEQCLEECGDKNVYVLGEIIHNPSEIERLEKKGLKTLLKDELKNFNPENSVAIIRAHGEPPSTYEEAERIGLELVDATCPLVKNLQNKVKKYFDKGFQIVIYGKHSHAEVVGLRGVCDDKCIVINSSEEALSKVDFTKKTVLFSQTTMEKKEFQSIAAALQEKFNGENESLSEEGKLKIFEQKDTICKYVSNRGQSLIDFANSNEVVIFVAGRNSSNGKSLFTVSYNANRKTYFIENIYEINKNWFENAKQIGITGATSTPQWYLILVKKEIEKILSLKK